MNSNYKLRTLRCIGQLLTFMRKYNYKELERTILQKVKSHCNDKKAAILGETF